MNKLPTLLNIPPKVEGENGGDCKKMFVTLNISGN